MSFVFRCASKFLLELIWSGEAHQIWTGIVVDYLDLARCRFIEEESESLPQNSDGHWRIQHIYGPCHAFMLTRNRSQNRFDFPNGHACHSLPSEIDYELEIFNSSWNLHIMFDIAENKKTCRYQIVLCGRWLQRIDHMGIAYQDGAIVSVSSGYVHKTLLKQVVN